jgi:HEAT repeat protein
MRCHFSISCLLILAAGCKGQDEQPQPPAVAQLTTMLQDPNPQVLLEAAAWIKELGPKAADTAPALKAALKNPNAAVRQSAALALGKIGPDVAEVIPALTSALGDTDHGVRRTAADALGQMGPAAQSAIPALEKLSKQADSCNSAQNALKKIRP